VAVAARAAAARAAASRHRKEAEHWLASDVGVRALVREAEQRAAAGGGLPAFHKAAARSALMAARASRAAAADAGRDPGLIAADTHLARAEAALVAVYGRRAGNVDAALAAAARGALSFAAGDAAGASVRLAAAADRLATAGADVAGARGKVLLRLERVQKIMASAH